MEPKLRQLGEGVNAEFVDGIAQALLTNDAEYSRKSWAPRANPSIVDFAETAC